MATEQNKRPASLIDDLKPCPNPSCGSTDIIDGWGHGPTGGVEIRIVHCMECRICIPHAIWNLLFIRSGKWVWCSDRLPIDQDDHLCILRTADPPYEKCIIAAYENDSVEWMSKLQDEYGADHHGNNIIAWWDGNPAEDLGWDFGRGEITKGEKS